MRVDISKDDVASVRALLSEIKGGAELAISRSINKGVSTGKTQAAKSIGQYLNLTATRIKKDFVYSFNSTKATLSGGVVATGQPVGLLNFGASQRASGEWSVKVLRKGQRKLLKHSFKAKTRKLKKSGDMSEQINLYWRINFGDKRTGTGKRFAAYFASLPPAHFKKLPLERLEGPRIEDIFAQPGIYDPIQSISQQTVINALGIETETILRRHNG